MLIWNVVENTKSRRSSLKLDFARKPTKESDLFFGGAFLLFIILVLQYRKSYEILITNTVILFLCTWFSPNIQAT